MGWYLGEIGGHPLTGHPGGVTGFNTQLQMAPADELAVITLANWGADWPFPASFTAMEVTYLLLGIEP